ncbi:MAG: cupredoxin domain-containing protein [Tepidisphaeraceae bacterium]
MVARRTLIAAVLGLVVGLPFCFAKEDADDASTVKIVDASFKPANLTVKLGTTVTWKNLDTRDHKVVAKDGSFHSGNLKNGDKFTYTFEKAGTYNYGCQYMPRMKGTIVVQ